MKKLTSLLLLCMAVFFTSCEGDPGPPGPQGPPGYDGGIFVAQSFERNINLTASNNYQETVVVPLDIELYESDMVLVYHFRGQVDNYDVWEMLPETIYTSSGEFQYNFEHNYDYITIFIDASATFNYNDLLPSDTMNQIFRVVILPVDFVNSRNIDISNYNEVVEFVK